PYWLNCASALWNRLPAFPRRSWRRAPLPRLLRRRRVPTDAERLQSCSCLTRCWSRPCPAAAAAARPAGRPAGFFSAWPPEAALRVEPPRQPVVEKDIAALRADSVALRAALGRQVAPTLEQLWRRRGPRCCRPAPSSGTAAERRLRRRRVRVRVRHPRLGGAIRRGGAVVRLEAGWHAGLPLARRRCNPHAMPCAPMAGAEAVAQIRLSSAEGQTGAPAAVPDG
ncbi:unnamed protein product, partial [Prorocentrum cordatum]